MKHIITVTALSTLLTTTSAANSAFAPGWSADDSWQVLVQDPHPPGSNPAEIVWSTYTYRIAPRTNLTYEASVLITRGASNTYAAELVLNTNEMVLIRAWSVNPTNAAREYCVENPFGQRSWMAEQGIGPQHLGVPDILVHFAQVPFAPTNTTATIAAGTAPWPQAPRGAFARSLPNTKGIFSETITFDPATNQVTAVLTRPPATTNHTLSVRMVWQGGKKWWLSSEETDLTADTEDEWWTRQALLDSDKDGMPDIWEQEMGFDGADPSDAEPDPDNDGLSNLLEFQWGTDPHNLDTDGDGVTDGQEVAAGTNPLNRGDYAVTVSGNVVSYASDTNDVEVMILETNALSPQCFQRLAFLPPTAGPFSFTNIPAGRTYWLIARHGSSPLSTAWGFFGAGPITVTGNIANVDIDLFPSVTISGTTQFGGQPVECARVTASWAPDMWGRAPADWIASSALSRDQGAFNLGRIVPGKRYWLTAFLDINTNDTKDAGEPYWQSGSNPIVVSTNGISNLVIDLAETNAPPEPQNLVTNGTFDGGDGYTCPNWSYEWELPTKWWNDNTANEMIYIGEYPSSLSQTVPKLTNGWTYQIVFQISSVGGQKQIQPKVGGTAGALYTTQGVHTQNLVAGQSGTIELVGQDPEEDRFSDIRVDNVQLYLISAP